MARLEEAEAPFCRHVCDALAERHPTAGGDDKSGDAAPR
jgi:hypothetical protein